MLGLSDHRHYPSERFFSIAAAEGCDTVIGCDAHNPQSLSDTAAQKKWLMWQVKMTLNFLGGGLPSEA